MEQTLRRANLGLIVVIWCGLLGVMAQGIADGWNGLALLIIGVGLAAIGLLFAATWQGWRHAPRAAIAVAVLLAAGGPPNTDFDTGNVLTLLLPAIVALIVGRSWWIVGSTLAAIALFAARSGGQSLASVNPTDAVVFGMLVGGLWFGRWIIEQALGAARQETARAEAALVQSAAHAEQIAAANQRQEAQLSEQQALLEVIAALEVPAVTLADGVLLAPLIGQLDIRRAQSLTARLLQLVHQRRTGCVVLDLSGLAAVDTVVAEALLTTAQALRLLGCQVMLSGISAQVATTVTDLGISMQGLRVVRSPQEALRWLAPSASISAHG
jgi:anti-anti-sigma regulatory factor